MSANWSVVMDYFSQGLPASEYLWIGVIVVMSAIGYTIARKMVSQI